MSTDTGTAATTGAAATGTGTASTTGTDGAAATQTGAAQTGGTQTSTGTQQTGAAQTGTGATQTADQIAAAAAATAAAADWRSGITDPDAKEFATRLASPADAVKVALDLRKANSAMIKVPGKDAKPEDIAKFHKAIGVPETVEGYKFDMGGREATDADKAIQGEISKVALAAGVPASAMAALSKAVTALATAQIDEQNRVAVEGRASAEASLRKEWGADYEANKTLATRAVQAFGEIKSHPEVIDFFDKTMVNGQKLGDHPIMVRMLGNIGRRMGEGDFIGAVGGNERTSLQTEANSLMAANPPGTEGYKKVAGRIMEINEALHGTGGIVGSGGRSV